MAIISLTRKGGQSLAKIFEDATVIDNQAVVLALVYAVGAGDGLHQGVCFKRPIQIEC